MIEEDTLVEVEVNSRWEAALGDGCELAVRLDSGKEMFVIRTGLEDADAEIEAWRDEHVGKQVVKVREITSVALETGGQQTTLDVTLAGGFRFEGDLLQDPAWTEKGVDELEAEWSFEGTPGVEMGETMPDEEDA